MAEKKIYRNSKELFEDFHSEGRIENLQDAIIDYKIDDIHDLVPEIYLSQNKDSK